MSREDLIRRAEDVLRRLGKPKPETPPKDVMVSFTYVIGTWRKAAWTSRQPQRRTFELDRDADFQLETIGIEVFPHTAHQVSVLFQCAGENIGEWAAPMGFHKLYPAKRLRAGQSVTVWPQVKHGADPSVKIKIRAIHLMGCKVYKSEIDQ